MQSIVFAIINGLASGASIFLVAAGVTLIYGILHILNFAHGSFLMVGAYVAFTIIGMADPTSLWVYLGAALIAGIVVAALGLLTDFLILRRLRDVDDYYSLIATFALLLCVDGVVKLIWGVEFHSLFPPQSLSGVLTIGSAFIPAYSVFVAATGLLVFIVLEISIHRMWVGKIVQALRHDRWMTEMMGVNVPMMFTGTVAMAFLLAGLAGGLLLSNQSLSPQLGHTVLIPAFVAVIIGGLGNVRGAFVASLFLGLVESIGTGLLQIRPGLMTYIAIALFLYWRPHGLLARKS
jgi:branched-chain amino acid transport system permease protein